MKILKNKYFILGNLALLLAVIPLTLFFISRQQDVRSRAAPTTRLSFTPDSITFEDAQCTEQSTTIRLDPGENQVGTVELFLTYDATKFDISIEPNENVFPEVLRGPTVSNGQASVILYIGTNVENVITEPVNIATVTVVPVASTEDGTASISIDSSKTKVIGIESQNQELGENLFLNGGQAEVSIDPACLGGEGEPSPTPTTLPGTLTPSPTVPVGGGGSITPTIPVPSVTLSPSPIATTSPGVNQNPVCSSLNTSPASTGAAPFALTLTASGTDANGTIVSAAFNFGDNTTQTVTQGLGTAQVTTQLSHTYQTAGTYNASVTFTDNNGAVSTSCAKQIIVTSSNPGAGAGSGGTGSGSGTIQPTATPTPTATIENPGGFETSIAIVIGIIILIIGGFALIALN